MVKCWDLESNKVIRHYHGHLSGVYSLTSVISFHSLARCKLIYSLSLASTLPLIFSSQPVGTHLLECGICEPKQTYMSSLDTPLQSRTSSVRIQIHKLSLAPWIPRFGLYILQLSSLWSAHSDSIDYGTLPREKHSHS
jgi:hypothetical protein